MLLSIMRHYIQYLQFTLVTTASVTDSQLGNLTIDQGGGHMLGVGLKLLMPTHYSGIIMDHLSNKITKLLGGTT